MQYLKVRDAMKGVQIFSRLALASRKVAWKDCLKKNQVGTLSLEMKSTAAASEQEIKGTATY